MHNNFLLLSLTILVIIFMKIATRKEELGQQSGWIISKNVNGYDHFWILNTSCYLCLIKFTCYSLNLYGFHSIILTSSFHFTSSDATFRNYSVCPDQFVARTDQYGFYFIYHYFFISQRRDYFNLSYSVIDNNTMAYQKNYEFKDLCVKDPFLNLCQIVKPGKDYNESKWSRHLWVAQDNIFANRFMHASTNAGSTLYVHGGLSSRNINDHVFIRFSNNIWEKVQIDSLQQPSCLYGHSMAYYETTNELILFGGADCFNESLLNDILWIFVIARRVWLPCTSIKVKSVMGHSIHIYQEIMYSFFGLTRSNISRYSLLSSIQRFNITSRQWMNDIPLQADILNIGQIYYCSFQSGDRVWLFGGLYYSQSKELNVSSQLYSFEFSTNEWTMLSDLGPTIYLHKCVIINRTLVTIGGLMIVPDTDYPARANVGFSSSGFQQFSSLMYSFKESSSAWSSNQINSNNIGHQVYASSNNSIVVIGGKSSAFQKMLQSIFYETCDITTHSKRSDCRSFTDQSHQPELTWKLISSDNCFYKQCDTCTRYHCAWCSRTNRCVSKLKFAAVYAIGGCEVPIIYESQCPIMCNHLTNSGCRNCTKLSFCGWCEFRKGSVEHLSGVGNCVDGTINGPLRPVNDTLGTVYCQSDKALSNWYFLPAECPSCNCNGHSSCNYVQYNPIKDLKERNSGIQQCSKCLHNTMGNNCQHCADGYQGSATNGQKCVLCKCVKEKAAGHCYADGVCDLFCIEKGRIGHYCHECDALNNFTKFYDMCVFKAKINFKYGLDKKTDNFNNYTDRVNFLLSDLISNMDLSFRIRCINGDESMIRVELFNESGSKNIILGDRHCKGFETIFPKSLFKGLFSYQLLFTVSGFKNSSFELFHIEMTFSQKTYINLPYIFISFFACLSASVLSFYTVYKLRQHINRRNHQYRSLFVMERPFAKIQLAVHSTESTADSSDNNTSLPPSYTTMLCVEPCRVHEPHSQTLYQEYRAISTSAVVTVLFLSPKCSSAQPRILLGSTVTKLTKLDRKMLLELPTRNNSGNSVMVDRDFDTSVSPSAAEELLTTEV